jgi:hypothetical protein
MHIFFYARNFYLAYCRTKLIQQKLKHTNLNKSTMFTVWRVFVTTYMNRSVCLARANSPTGVIEIKYNKEIVTCHEYSKVIQ